MNRILLIDDERNIQDLWKKFHAIVEPTFRGQCELDCASSLEQGMARIKGVEYDAIIIDLTMPPMGKDEVITWIYEYSKTLPPIIVLTGDEDEWTRRKCIMAGASGFFTKHDAHSFPNLFFKELYNEYLKRYAANRESPTV